MYGRARLVRLRFIEAALKEMQRQEREKHYTRDGQVQLARNNTSGDFARCVRSWGGLIVSTENGEIHIDLHSTHAVLMTAAKMAT